MVPETLWNSYSTLVSSRQGTEQKKSVGAARRFSRFLLDQTEQSIILVTATKPPIVRIILPFVRLKGREKG